MKEKYAEFVKKIICSMFLTCFIITSTRVTAIAEDNVNLMANELTLTINYPSGIKCGESVKFIMNAGGGSGNYKYRIAALMDSNLVSVYDISYGSNGVYKDSNEFEFTFYASGTYYIRFSVMDMTTNNTKMTGLYEYPIVIEDADYPSVNQLVDSISTQCEAICTTDFEKALWLHDWIIDNADYDYTYSYCSPEGVLARGKGTCESYHRAYEMLLNKVGIDTGRITGNGHVWTAVKMDGEWYQVDTTWDDMGANYKGTYYEHMYFGVNDYIIGLVHDEHKEPVTGYESMSLENNYFIKTGEISKWSDQFINAIKSSIEAGQKQFTISVADSMPDNFKNVIYNLVAYKLGKEDWNGNQLSVSYSDSILDCKVVKSAEETPEDKPENKPEDKPGETPGDKPGETPENKSDGILENKPVGTSVYEGVDYSAVYNYNYYISHNGDIKAALGDDDVAVLRHFVTYGMAEARQGSAAFNVMAYKSKNLDLRMTYGDDWKSYYMHYISYGKNEGRTATGDTAITNGITVYNGVDYSNIYNYQYYITNNPDVNYVFPNDDKKAIEHFVNYGMSEGRQAIEQFNVISYRKRYGDLRNAFRNDTKAYYLHYNSYGKDEGRIATGDVEIGGQTVYNGIDYAGVYDYNYYVNKYRDIYNAYGIDDEAVLEHFVKYGMAEGRQGKEQFNVNVYYNNYDDLRNTFGNDWKLYYLHYINYGISEGRKAY